MEDWNKDDEHVGPCGEHKAEFVLSVDLSELYGPNCAELGGELGDRNYTQGEQCSGRHYHIENEHQNRSRRKSKSPLEKKVGLKEEKKSSQKRTITRTRLALKAERADAMAGTPRRFVKITPQVVMPFDFQRQWEQLIRAYNAYIGVQRGMNISQSWQKVSKKCRNNPCSASLVFDWQPPSGLWKLKQFTEQINDCGGQHVHREAATLKSVYCAPAYTSLQVVRTILSEPSEDPSISARKIGQLVRSKEIYRRQPPDRHYCSVRVEVMIHMAASRVVDMATLEKYAELLW